MSETSVILKFSDFDMNFTDQKDIRVTNINIGMPVPKNETASFSGSVGQRLLNHTYDSFPITFEFDLLVETLDDLVLRESELRSLFNREAEYYFIYSKEPGKQYPVIVDSVTAARKAFFASHFVVSFNVLRGYAESLAATLSDFILDVPWQFSQGIPSEDYSYTQEVSRFTIFNAGDFLVDPRENYLRITLEGESEGNATIFNKTTGDRFIYYKPLSVSLGQTLIIDNVYPKLNGVNCGIDTNHGLITLVEGENEIEIQNISRVKTSWDFRFLYK